MSNPEMVERYSTQTTRLVFVMVGLPARGKSYLARRLLRYLSWLGYRTRVFNVGSYRRRLLGGRHDASFFAPDHVEGRRLRREMAMAAADDLAAWFSEGGEVAIYDATNTTRARRRLLLERFEPLGLQVVFIESLTDEATLIEENIQDKQRHSPDYTGVAMDVAMSDFRVRLAHYQSIYEPLNDEEHSYIKIVDAGRQVIANRIHGFLPSRAVYILMNLHLERRPIMLTRHGESVFNAKGRIGGDSGLTQCGLSYASELSTFVHDRFPDKPPVVWTSTLRRTRETAAVMGVPFVEWRALDEIEAGICNALTYEEIKERFPEEYTARKEDKLRYRYPRGESYMDVIERVSPLILELERQREPVVVVAHQAVLRVLYAYFVHKPLSACPYSSIPLHTVIELTPSSYGCDEQRHPLSDTVRESDSG